MKIKIYSLIWLLLLTTMAKAQIDLSNGLVMYLPLNGTVNDTSGNSQNGTLNGATLTSDRFGKPRSAYSFNGSSNYISFPVTNALTNFFSYSIWVSPAEIPSSGNYTYPLAIGGTGGGSNIALTNNSMQGWGAGSANNGTPSTSLVAVGVQPTVGQWYHIVLIRDTNKIKLYVNGVLNTNEVSYGGLNTNTGGNLPAWGSQPKGSLGARMSANFFKGKIDEVRVYNRILTEDEIDSLFKHPNNSNNTSISTNSVNENYIKVYPNPAQNIIFIMLNNSIELDINNVQIYNVNGQLVNQNLLNFDNLSNSFDVSNLASGVYYINYTSIDGSIYRTKFIVS